MATMVTQTRYCLSCNYISDILLPGRRMMTAIVPKTVKATKETL